jgi:tetratricopeptide (TPR) repeat protein
MRSLLTAFVLLILLIMTSPVIFAQEWGQRTQAGEMAFAYGNMKLAEREFRAALEIAQQLPEGDHRLETSLENLGRLFEHQARWNQAQPLYELLVVAQAHRAGKQSPVLLSSLLAAGRVALQAPDPPSAEAHLKRFVELADLTGKADAEELRAVLSMLSRMYVLRERTDEALALQRRSVGMLGPDSILTPIEKAAEIETLAQLELLHGSVDEARQLLLDAIELRREDDKTVSAAAELVIAANTAYAAGEPDLAEELARLALAAKDGAEHALAIETVLADVAWLKVRRASTSLEELLAVVSDSPDLVVAEERLSNLIQRHQSEAGTGAQVVDTLIARLVQVQAVRGHADAAAATQQQLVASFRNVGGTPLRSALSDLAVLLVSAGRDSEAVEVYGELIPMLETANGVNDPRLIPTLQTQMELLKQLGRKKEAKAIKKRLKKLRKSLRL